MRDRDALRVYYIVSACLPFLGTTIWVLAALYYILVVHMSPLQLVLVGTTLELSYFLFQIPTGVLADALGRKWPVVIGVLLVGTARSVQGLVPAFAVIIAAECLHGAGWSSIDGAWHAWLSDEIGQDRFGRATLRGAQLGQAGSLIGTWAGVALASIRLGLPMVVGGAATCLVGVFLAATMREDRRVHERTGGVSRLTVMHVTLRDGLLAVRGSRPLLLLLLCAAIYGAFSEGFDRLWEAHLLRDVHFPSAQLSLPVWFGLINTVSAVMGIVVVERVRRTVDTTDDRSLMRGLTVTQSLLILTSLVFALAHSFVPAVAGFLIAGVMRSVPLFDPWINNHIADSRIRATVMSITAQADAAGQMAGGPGVGAVGSRFSIRAALTISALLLVPQIPIFRSVPDRIVAPEEPVYSSASARNSRTM